MSAISRRTLVTTSASLLASSASLMLLRRVDAATHDATTSTEEHHTDDKMKRCIELCQNCHALCIQLVGHGVKLGGRHAAPEHIRLLLDCAQICATTADYMARESAHHQRVCSLCSEICRLCAESCEQVDRDDQLLKQCAEMCRHCAESCKKMASKEV